MDLNIKNKRGASLSGFTEVGILVILFLISIGILMTAMNLNYSQNYDATFGISPNETKGAFEDYQGTLGKGLEGEASQVTDGISVLTSWSIIKSGIKMVYNLVTGNFITNAFALMDLGEAGDYLAWAFRLLFIFAIGFIMIKILFKVKP